MINTPSISLPYLIQQIPEHSLKLPPPLQHPILKRQQFRILPKLIPHPEIIQLTLVPLIRIHLIPEIPKSPHTIIMHIAPLHRLTHHMPVEYQIQQLGRLDLILVSPVRRLEIKQIILKRYLMSYLPAHIMLRRIQQLIKTLPLQQITLSATQHQIIPPQSQTLIFRKRIKMIHTHIRTQPPLAYITLPMLILIQSLAYSPGMNIPQKIIRSLTDLLSPQKFLKRQTRRRQIPLKYSFHGI